MQSHWIFQLNRNLHPTESDQLTTLLQTSLAEWKAHGVPVKHRLAVLHDRFVVIHALSDASGCSIDWLNREVEQHVAQVSAAIEDPSQICYRTESGIECLHFMNLIQAIRAKGISPQTIMFDNTVVHGGTMADWEKRIEDSWLAPRIGETA